MVDAERKEKMSGSVDSGVKRLKDMHTYAMHNVTPPFHIQLDHGSSRIRNNIDVILNERRYEIDHISIIDFHINH